MPATGVLSDADFPAEWGDEVPARAFVDRRDVVRAVLPSRIVKVNKSAFRSCSGLEELELPNVLVEISNFAFEGCSALKAVVLPVSLKVIGVQAFSGCSALKQLSLPLVIEEIGFGAFLGCSRVTELSLPDGLLSLPPHAFMGCCGLKELVLPDTLTTIGDSAFFGCAGLVEVTLPPSVTTFGARAFHSCDNLRPTKVLAAADFPAAWGDEVPAGAFADRRDVVRAVLPNRIQNVGDRAFAGCSGLRAVVLPDALQAIGIQAFRGCSALEALNLPDALQTVGTGAFTGCAAVKELTVPLSLNEIKSGTFANCSGLATVNFQPTRGSTLQSIGEGAFRRCSSLVGLELPPSVRTISGSSGGEGGHAGAFEGCAAFRTLIMPPALTSLGAGCFAGSMANLEMLVIPQSVPPGVVTSMVAMLGPRREHAPDAKPWHPKVDLEATSTVKLVSAPDAVVASLGGVFVTMATMADVRTAGRDIISTLDYHHWTVKTHTATVCTPLQRACAHTVLLVGSRLDILPDELWLEVLGWLRRSELGAGSCAPVHAAAAPHSPAPLHSPEELAAMWAAMGSMTLLSD